MCRALAVLAIRGILAAHMDMYLPCMYHVHGHVVLAIRPIRSKLALTTCQELLLILEEYWREHPELHDVPIYYASKVTTAIHSHPQTHFPSAQLSFPPHMPHTHHAPHCLPHEVGKKSLLPY